MVWGPSGSFLGAFDATENTHGTSSGSSCNLLEHSLGHADRLKTWQSLYNNHLSIWSIQCLSKYSLSKKTNGAKRKMEQKK